VSAHNAGAWWRRVAVPVAVHMERVDRHRWLLPAAAGGLLAGSLLAWLGQPAVDMHGPLHYAGIMDPLCGATRAVRHALRAEWARSWAYNPLGIPLVVGAALALVRAAVGLTARRWLTVGLHWTRGLVAVLLLLVVVLEINQQTHADLLTLSVQLP
jgi:hypothetical protein